MWLKCLVLRLVQRATSSNQFFMAGVDEEAATKMLESATKGEMMEQPEQEKEPESGGEKGEESGVFGLAF